MSLRLGLACLACLAAAADAPPVKPWRDGPDARHLDGPRPGRIVAGSFLIEGAMAAEPSLRCDYRIPVGADGRPLPAAADIVIAIAYQGADDPFLGRTGLAERHGFTLVGVGFPHSAACADDPQRFYIYPASGSGEAWRQAVRTVRRLAGYPERPVYVLGLSSGGTAAQRFAEAYPAEVAALVSWAGMTFAEPPRFTGPTLLGSSLMDRPRNPCIDRLAEAMAGGGTPVCRLLAVPPVIGESRLRLQPVDHSLPGGEVATCVDTWLAECADARNRPHPPVPGDERPRPGAWFPGRRSSELAQRVALSFACPWAADDPARDGDRLVVAPPAREVPASDLVVLVSHDPLEDQAQQLFDIYEHTQAGRTVIGVFDHSRSSSAKLLAALRRLPRRAFGSSGRAAIIIAKPHPSDPAIIASIPGRRAVIYRDLAGDDPWVDLARWRDGGTALLLATRPAGLERLTAERFVVRNHIDGWFVPRGEVTTPGAAHYFLVRCAEAVLAGLARPPPAGGWGEGIIPVGPPP